MRDPLKDIARIRKKLRHFVLEPVPPKWLDAGSPGLNAVLGSETHGVPYGKILELYGPASHGKTMLAMYLARQAQQAGSPLVWMDFENSFDDAWASSQGIDTAATYRLGIEAGRFGKSTGDPRLQTAEELFREAEELVVMFRRRDPESAPLVVVDSVAAILPGYEAEAGIDGQNMKTKLSLASFLGSLLRRWTALCQTHGVLMLLVNQVREKPGLVFGSPEYTPGGRALPFYASIRAEVRRVKGGRLLRLGRVVGLRGRIRNVKNKAGAGSVEGCEIGYMAKFGIEDGWKFPEVKEVGKDDAAV